MGARRPSLAAAGALACAALALWVSFGALSFVEADNRAPYVGLLPPFSTLALLLFIAGAIAFVLRPTAHAVAPLWLSAVALLPWVPLPLPFSVFIWTGRSLIWLWAAIAVALLAPNLGRLPAAERLARLSPRTASVVAGLLALLAYGLGAWAVAPAHPNGDEPHYLIITQSILRDHDLKIENNHRQGDYLAYIDRSIPPDFLKRGTDGQIYSVHAPGLSLLVAPFFALWGYPGVVASLVLLGAVGSGLIWSFAWRATGDAGASWFAWAGVALSVPFFFHASSVFPEATAAVMLLFALLPLDGSTLPGRRSLFWAGAALGTLPWLHSRFAILAASAALVIAGRVISSRHERVRCLAALAAFPVVSGAAWFLFFQTIYGTPNPSVVYGGNTNTAISNIVRGAPGLLFDQQFGLVSSAPVYLGVFTGVLVMLRQGRRRLVAELGIVIVPYFFVVGFFFMWWAGTTPPARFLVSIAPLLVAPIAIWYAASKTVARTAGLVALLISLLMTATMTLVDRGAFVFNFRDGMSRVAAWLTPVVDLTKALPSLFQNPPLMVVYQTAVWCGTLGAAILVAKRLRRARAPMALAVGLPLQIAIMAGASWVWQNNGAVVPRPNVAGPALLQTVDAVARQIAVSYRPFHRLDVRDLPGRVVLARAFRTGSGEEAIDLPSLPAGTYEVRGTVIGSAAGNVVVRTDRLSGPIEVWFAGSLGSTWTRQVTIPIDVAGLRVEVDKAARTSIRDVSIHAVSLSGAPEGFENREARRGARYGQALVFLLDGQAWVEPVGTWVAGASSAEFAIAPDPGRVPSLFLRNGPVANEVALESGAWRERVTLRPGEEQLIDVVPMHGRHSPTPLNVTAATGFRPAEVDPKSQDQRYLGVWIETR
jgi:hypothetical protein